MIFYIKKHQLFAIKLFLLLYYSSSNFYHLFSKKNCWYLLHKQFLSLFDSNMFYISSLFVITDLYLIYYLTVSSILSKNATILYLIQQRFFSIFSYKVLKILLKLDKKLITILYKKNINFFSIQVFIIYLRKENYLYF